MVSARTRLLIWPAVCGLKYPSSIKVVELPCTGKFDVLYALRGFEDGADAVMVAG